MNRIETLRRIEQEIVVLRYRAKRIVHERAAIIHPDLAPPAYIMLATLADQGPLRASDLVERFELDKGAVSRHLHHLTQLGLIVRAPDPADGRASLLSASPHAVEQLEQIWADRRQWAADRLQDWSLADLDALAAGLSRYNEALDDTNSVTIAPLGRGEVAGGES